LENDLSNRADSEKLNQLSELKIVLKYVKTSNKLKSFLLSSGKWIFDFADDFGREFLVSYIKTQ